MIRIITASVFTVLGFLTILVTVYPFFVWQFYYLPKIENQRILSPLANYEMSNSERVSQESDNRNAISEFFISVPKLGIDEAKVEADSTDFYSSLAHYPQTALPGERGNVFITGHSVLPYFFDPKNYYSIFSTLHTLERGDEITISLPNSNKYRYIVIGMAVVNPEDTWVLKTPDRDGNYVSLFTCTPPGLTTKRLVVLGKEV